MSISHAAVQMDNYPAPATIIKSPNKRAHLCMIPSLFYRQNNCSDFRADKDECLDGTDNNCAAEAKCMNTDGGFDCVCNAGYGGDGVTCAGRYPCYHNLKQG